MTSPGVVPRIAAIGVGYWGRNIARNFAELGALAAVVDADAGQGAAVAASTGAPLCDLAAVLADPAIAGVAIATRAETHFAIAMQAIAAGKHVFVEKPLVLDEAEADRLIAAADAAGRVLMVGHLLRYHPLFEALRGIVASGDHGRLRYVYSDRMSLGKIRTEEDVMWSFAPHDLSMVLALAGAEPVAVTAQTTAFVAPPIADHATIQLRFADGLAAEVRTSWLHYRKVQQLVAICDRATIVFADSEPDWDRKLAVHMHEIVVEDGIPVPKRGSATSVAVPQAEPLRTECAHFLDCIASGARPITDGTEGRAVLRVLRRATEAARTGNAA